MAVPNYEFDTAQSRLIDTGVRQGRRALSGSTDARRELAVTLVDLRETFTDADGRIDYRGESAGYKAAAARIFELLDITKAQRVKLRESVKHHVSQVRAARLSPDQLVMYGLNAEARNDTRRRRNEEAAQPPRTAHEMGQRLRAFSALLPDDPALLPLDDMSEADVRALQVVVDSLVTFLSALANRVDSHLEAQDA